MASSSGRKRINTGRYLTGAFLYIIRLPLLITTIVIIGYAVFHKDPNTLMTAGGFLLLTIIVNLLFLWKSSQIPCRLCRAQFLRNLKCAKKAHAPQLLGSYTLPVALSILGRKKRICCPYCGEKHPYFYKD